MLSKDQRDQFSEILEELGKTLDITEKQYNSAVQSYNAVGSWLSSPDSTLAPYRPEILPQGSFMLGTMIRPICDDDDLDIDLACQLKGKNPNWTQEDLKNKVGDRLKAHGTYEDMIDEEGRRCWTLLYRQDSGNTRERYHMDILPSIVDFGYRMILEKAFSVKEFEDVEQLGIRITDRDDDGYKWDTNHLNWLKSNPFGYGRWFFNRASLDLEKSFSLRESVAPVPKYQNEKLPLQRVVQILKRHRDMMFNGDENKPISILAARAYQKETDILSALMNVVRGMRSQIEERWSSEYVKFIKWVSNPVNDKNENFADRWQQFPEREDSFFNWLDEVEKDVNLIVSKRGDLRLIKESMEKPFGKELIEKSFSAYGANQLKSRNDGLMKMASGSGMLGSTGITVKRHDFHGDES